MAMPDANHAAAPRLRVTVVEAGIAPTPVVAAGSGLMLCIVDLADAAALPRPGPDDVLVLDLRGADAARSQRAVAWMAAQADRTPCVVVGPPGDLALARLALRSGARAWLGRHARPADVLAAVCAVAAGRLHLGSTGQHALCGALAEATPR